MALTKGTDSYATVAEADDYVALTALASTWDALADAAKEIYLKRATQQLDDQVEWPGIIAVRGQSLDWPREAVSERRGRGELLDRTVTPPEIERACSEQAAALAAEDREADDLSDFVMRDGSTVLTPGGRKVLSDAVRDILHGSGYGYVQRSNEVRILDAARG